jgi:TonB family protein
MRRRPLVFALLLILVPAGAHAQPPAPTPVVTAPVVLSHVDAVYPASAVPTAQHIDVVLAVTVDADGNVSRVDVLESGGDAVDEAAKTAVRQWKFRPATRGGQPIKSRIKVPFHFAPLAPPQEITPKPQTEPVVPGNVVGQQAGGQAVTGPSPESLGQPAAASPSSPAPPPPAPPPPSAPPAPQDVEVHGRTAPPLQGASDFRIRIEELKDIPRANASDVLKLAPGIMLQNEGGEGHAEQVFLRGFDAREGQDLELTVGGVPINEAGNLHGNGYADTHFIIPELIQGLRVLEGPFDTRQGNFAVAGSADYELGLEQRGLTAKYTQGSYGTERALLTWGPKDESTHTFAAAEIYKTNGYGENRDAQRATAYGQYEGKLGEHGSWRVTAQGYTTNYHSAGVIREDDYDAHRIGFFDTYDPRQGGDSSRYSVAADVESKSGDTLLGQQFFVIDRSMRLLEDFTGFLLDVQTPLQQPHDQRGDLIDLSVSEQTIGARGFARWETRALDQKQELELGYFARGDHATGTQYRDAAATGVPYHEDTNLDSKLGDIGMYADANLKPLKWLAVRGGVHADLLTYDVLNNCAVQSVAHPSETNPPGDASCLSQQDFGYYREPVQEATTSGIAVMPRGTVIAGPFDGFNLTASGGQAVRSLDPIDITQDAAAPFARVTSGEGGAMYAGGTRDVRLVARSIFFETKVNQDLIFDELVGRNVLTGATTRTGWVGAVRATGTFWDESANATLVKATYDATGLLFPYVPDVVLRSDTAFFHDLPWTVLRSKMRGRLSLGVTYVGPRPLPYGQRSDDIFTVDGSASVVWKMFELSVASTNLLDSRYKLGEYNYVSDFHTQPQPTLVPMREFTAGPPRMVFVSLSATLGGS